MTEFESLLVQNVILVCKINMTFQEWLIPFSYHIPNWLNFDPVTVIVVSGKLFQNCKNGCKTVQALAHINENTKKSFLGALGISSRDSIHKLEAILLPWYRLKVRSPRLASAPRQILCLASTYLFYLGIKAK